MSETAPQAGPISLSPEQHAVVSHRGSHLQVVACAGSGKTEAISRRVAGLIDEGVEPYEIIAFTFTERAATALKARITKRVAESKGGEFLDRLGPMFVGTIHSYCLRLLQDHVPQYGNFDVLTEHRLAGLLSREHKRIELAAVTKDPRHWRPIFDFRRNVDVVENEQIPLSMLAGTAFGKCLASYQNMLARYHYLTFGQLISAAVAALKTPTVFERVHNRLRHLIVDEYQDINPAQEELIRLLGRPPVQVCVVGDDDQAIYQWRGSDVDNILTFKHRYHAVERSLSVNRRSRPTILATANTFAKSIAPRLDKAMEPFRPNAELELLAWAADTQDDEAETIASTIERLHAKGYRYKDVAVLFRSVRTSSPPLVAALKVRGIPFRCAGRTGLFQQPEASALGRLYAWLSGNDWKNERFGESEPVTLDQLVASFGSLFGPSVNTADLERYLEDWRKLSGDDTKPVNLVRDYYRLLQILGVQQIDLEQPEASARMGCLARFSEILADYEHVTRRARYLDESGQRVFRGGTDRGIYFYRRLFNYLQHYALDAYEDFEGEDTFHLDAVDILTVHQAKGLEWPVVFIPALVKGRFPSRRAGEAQEWLVPDAAFPQNVRRRYEGGDAEERRLFYVALTRAKDLVYLSRFRRMKNRFHPSDYLLEVAGGDPPVRTTLPLPGPFVPPADEVEELPTLSFSELALYEGCPLRYRLSSSLGFQPQLATELGYGKAIHHILRRLADTTRATGTLPTLADVNRIFEDEFYLPFANKPAFDQLLGRARALVDKYLGEYRDDLLRVWETERAFALHLDNGVVNGRADVILDREGGVVGALALVDYKTATEQTTDDVFAFQLAIYAAAGRGEGVDVTKAYLHELTPGTRREVPVDSPATTAARVRASALVDGVLAGTFPPRPDSARCKRCDVKAICRHAQVGKYDW